MLGYFIVYAGFFALICGLLMMGYSIVFTFDSGIFDVKFQKLIYKYLIICVVVFVACSLLIIPYGYFYGWMFDGCSN